MEDTLISYGTAKLAKEKGFNIYQLKQYSKGVNSKTLYDYNENQCRMFNDTYYASTQSLLAKWLRENHNIHINIDTILTGEDEIITEGYDAIVYTCWKDKVEHELKIISSSERINLFKSYEDALEFALDGGLKLIPDLK